MTLRFVLNHRFLLSRRLERQIMSKVSDAIKEAVATIGQLAAENNSLKSENAGLTSANAELQTNVTDLTKKVSDLEELLSEDGATADDIKALQDATAAVKVTPPAAAPAPSIPTTD